MCEPKFCHGFLDPNRYKKVPFPHKITSVEQDNVLVGPEKWYLPRKYANEAEILYNFEVRSDDIWIISYPCSGAVVIQEMVWLMTHNYDFERAYEESLDDRSPLFEASILVEDEVASHIHKESSSPKECLQLLQKYTIPRWQVLRDTMKRRIIKTHLPFNLLPHNLMNVGCKIIYVARHPKDVVTSAYYLNHFDKFDDDTQNFTAFCKDFQNDKQFYCPYWEHIRQGFEKKDQILCLWYEDVLKDMSKTIDKVSTYVGSAVREDQTHKLKEHLMIQTFKTKVSFNQGLLNKYMMFDNGSDVIHDVKDNTTIEDWIKNNAEALKIVF